MPFSSLPQELVDHIAFCSGVSEQGLDDVFIIKNLVNFCLVSKQTVSSARAALYRRPFAWPSSLPGQYIFGVGPYKADGLLEALEANGYALGRVVRGTSGISDWVRTTGDDARIRKWYSSVLRACPNLRQVDLHFSTQTELEDLLRILSLPDPTTPQNFPFRPTLPFASPLSRLQCLDFNDRYWKSKQGIQVLISDVCTTLGRFTLSSLETVNLTRVYWCEEDDGSNSLFPFAIKHLCIQTREEYFADWIALSSRFPPSLDTFTLNGYSNGGTIDLTPFTIRHSGHLQKLELKFNDFGFETMLSEYTASYSDDAKISIEGFRSCPLLTSLILSGTHGPSLHFLSTLAESSPLLRILDLTHSRWISDSDPLSTVPDEIFPETRVLSELEQIKHLEDVHLGVLPTIDQDRYGTLVESLELRGVKPFLFVEYASDPLIRQRIANLLLTSLESNDGALGGLVRDTLGIKFLLPKRSPGSRIRSQDDGDFNIRTPEWYRRVLKACPRLTHLDLCFTIKEDLHEVLDILESSRDQGPSSSSLSTIRFFEWDQHNYNRSFVEPNYIEVFGAFRRELTRSVDSIKFDNVTWGISSPLQATPWYPFPIRRLDIQAVYFFTSLAATFPLFPRSPVNLEFLSYHGPLNRKNVLALPNFAGSTLRSLRLQATGDSDIMYLEEYATLSNKNLLPIQAFQSFPLLRNLEIFQLYGLSLTILRDLANFCPLLTNIEFNASYWVSETLPHSTSLDDVFPESEIPDTLQMFSHLKSVHLGILPTLDYSRYDNLTSRMKEQGVQVGYAACYEY
ncbi:hypothetical protein JCM5353_008876 [Sporobolomyces roseus]